MQDTLDRYGLKLGDAILAEPKHEALYEELTQLNHEARQQIGRKIGEGNETGFGQDMTAWSYEIFCRIIWLESYSFGVDAVGRIK